MDYVTVVLWIILIIGIIVAIIVKKNMTQLVGFAGEFIGCLSFPKCRYTKVIKQNNNNDDTVDKELFG